MAVHPMPIPTLIPAENFGDDGDSLCGGSLGEVNPVEGDAVLEVGEGVTSMLDMGRGCPQSLTDAVEALFAPLYTLPVSGSMKYPTCVLQDPLPLPAIKVLFPQSTRPTPPSTQSANHR